MAILYVAGGGGITTMEMETVEFLVMVRGFVKLVIHQTRQGVQHRPRWLGMIKRYINILHSRAGHCPLFTTRSLAFLQLAVTAYLDEL